MRVDTDLFKSILAKANERYMLEEEIASLKSNPERNTQGMNRCVKNNSCLLGNAHLRIIDNAEVVRQNEMICPDLKNLNKGKGKIFEKASFKDDGLFSNHAIKAIDSGELVNISRVFEKLHLDMDSHVTLDVKACDVLNEVVKDPKWEEALKNMKDYEVASGAVAVNGWRPWPQTTMLRMDEVLDNENMKEELTDVVKVLMQWAEYDESFF